jgi:hypothetical protein
MKKRYWKDRAKRLQEMLIDAQTRESAVAIEAYELRREVEDKRKNWAPIKIAHPYTPRDPGCMFCDDPQDDLRHVTPRMPEAKRDLAAQLLRAANTDEGHPDE